MGALVTVMVSPRLAEGYDAAKDAAAALVADGWQVPQASKGSFSLQSDSSIVQHTLNLGGNPMTWASPAMNDDEFAKLTAVEPGIPPYMRRHVISWTLNAMGGYPRLDGDVAADLALTLKVDMSDSYRDWEAYLQGTSDARFVTILDWLMYHTADAAYESERLQELLDNGHSEWTVSHLEDPPRMAKRIPEGVQETLERTVSLTGAAGSLLAQAFNSIYGASPNPNHAYDLAVKSVETFACPLFLPSNTRATLGSVYAHLSQKDVSLPLREADVPDKELIVDMMKKLFLGAERHGSTDYQHVSLEGAKAALSLATALLSMLHEDVITVS